MRKQNKYGLFFLLLMAALLLTACAGTRHTTPFKMCAGSSKPIWLSTTELQWRGSTYRL